MKRIKNSLFYLIVIGGFSVLIYWGLLQGIALQQGRNITVAKTTSNKWHDFIDGLIQNLSHPLALLLAQIITIILVARLFGWICKKIGQPSVIGEIVAGIVLGPSLAGLYFPAFSAFLFPAQSLGNLQFLSQIGLILFMFVVGMELDLKVLKNKAHEAVVISHASIIFPFALGIGLAYFIYPHFAPQGINFASFALFTGISLSITAFPVLARIIQERGIHKTRLGTIVITCAAADDITAWCILATVIAIVKAGSFVSALYTIALAGAYVMLMIYIVRPFLKRVGDLYVSKEHLSKGVIALIFLTLIISAYTTEVIGIHALFGAFMAGAIMPTDAKFRNMFVEKVEDIALVMLLPLFFVFTGLRTQIGLLNDVYLWKVTGLIILAAVTGKFIGSAVAAKVVGQSWKNSLVIGALMNTRGLMELVVLNIGYDLGVLKPELFAMMVIMALVTTFMTGPALDLIGWFFSSKVAAQKKIKAAGQYNILISFNNAERGRALLRVAQSFIKKTRGNASVTAMHLARTNELHLYNIDDYKKESFTPIIEESKKIGQPIRPLFRAATDVDTEIVDVANEGHYDLLLMGVARSIYEGSLLGRILGFTAKIINPERLLDQVTGKENLFEEAPFDERTRVILSKTKIPVGVFIDKGLQQIQAIFIPALSATDAWLLPYAEKLVSNTGARVTVLDTAEAFKKLPPGLTTNKNSVKFTTEASIIKDFLEQQHLMLISEESWRKLVELKLPWLSEIPSALILVKK
ncbi:cation:proton antiporter [Ferruginibacter sp. SUN106]|uniref:cation:proton antiporter domain-containing protein n=1 Tax=Ferruginibacter sp. SUN106 TaxID=2978348 RepID=UPI003D35EE5A